MTILSEPPPLVNRVSEMARLKEALEEAKGGKGQLLFLAGEAGQGKTRLSSEVESVALGEGFAVGRGTSLEESPVLYLPWIEALRSINLEHVLSEGAPPRLESLYLLTKGGLVAARAEREVAHTDTDILGGMISAVTTFLKDAFANIGNVTVEGSLARLSHGANTILVQRADGFGICAIVKGRENEAFLGELFDTASRMEERYGPRIRAWNGDQSMSTEWSVGLKELLVSGRWEGADIPTSNPEGRRWNLFDNVVQGLLRKSRLTPVLVIIDDLQWADPSSLSLLHYVARNTRKASFLLIGAYRTEEAGNRPHLDRALAGIAKEDLADTISIGRLPDPDARALVSLIVGKNELPSGFFEEVDKETEGNPLYVREVLRSLHASKSILRDQDGVVRLVGGLQSLQVPDRIRDALAHRLYSLSKDELRILNAAAVAGSRFPGVLVAKMLGGHELSVLETLQELAQRHHILVIVEDGFKFDHPLTREVVLSSISVELARVLHLAAAHALAEKSAEEAAIGEHFLSASDPAGVPFLVKAAQRAAEMFAHDETARFLKGALTLLKDNDNSRAEILEMLAQAEAMTGNYDAAISSLREAAVHCPTMLEEAQAKVAQYLEMTGRKPEALDLCKQAEERTLLSPVDRARWLVRKASLLKNTPRDALDLLDKAEQVLGEENVSDSTSNKELLVRTVIWRVRGVCQFFEGDYEAAASSSHRSYEVGKSAGNLVNAATALGNEGGMLMLLGRDLDSEKVLEESLRLSEQSHAVHPMILALGNLSSLCTHQLGQVERGLRLAERALAVAESSGLTSKVCDSLHSIGGAYMQLGDYEKAASYYEKARGLLRQFDPNYYLMPDSLSRLAQALLKLGRTSEASKLSEEALMLIGDKGSVRDRVEVLFTVVRSRLKQGDLEGARKAQVELRIAAEKEGGVEAQVNSLQCAGLVSAAEREYERATDFHRKSVELARKGPSSYPALVYSCELEWGRTDSLAGAKVDAATHFNVALDGFRSLGLAMRAKEAEKELEKLR